MAKRQVIWVKDKFCELRKLYSKCPICGKDNDEDSEFAHIKETGLNGMGRGLWNRYYDIVNNLDSYRLMHKDCHKYYDAIIRDY